MSVHITKKKLFQVRTTVSRSCTRTQGLFFKTSDPGAGPTCTPIIENRRFTISHCQGKHTRRVKFLLSHSDMLPQRVDFFRKILMDSRVAESTH